MNFARDTTSSSEASARSVILVVEDEALLALELEQVLTEAGYEVVLAADSISALAWAADPSVRLRAAIVDLHRPVGVGGQDIARRLRAQCPGLPLVVVTGYSPSSPQADLRGLGGPTARLQKPIQPAWLLQRLGEAMASITGVA